MTDLDLTKAITLVLDQQRIIIDSLSKIQPPAKPAKDIWDKFSSVSTFISGVLLAAIGLTFTLVYNTQQARRDQALREDQNKIAKIQSVAPFTPYLMADDDVKMKRHHAVQILALLPDKDLARALTTEFPNALTLEVVKSFQDKSHPDVGKDVAGVTIRSSAAGHTILFDGFKNYAVSGFNFSTRTVVPWGTEHPDIEVANPGGEHSNAVLFFENDAPPYTDKDFPPGKSPANGGIVKMPQQALSDIKEAPESGYSFHYFTPEIGALYCVRTWDGQHFAKIKITDVTLDRIGFEWVYQSSERHKFD
jgi:hypothetical protein